MEIINANLADEQLQECKNLVKIGRASCRERVQISVVAVSLKKKKKKTKRKKKKKKKIYKKTTTKRHEASVRHNKRDRAWKHGELVDL